MSLTKEWRHRIMAWRHELAKHFYQAIGIVPLKAAFTFDQYRLQDALQTLSFNPIEPGDGWGAKWEYGWFKGEITLPEEVDGQIIALIMDVGAESAVYINGDYAGAVDEFHKTILITELAKTGDRFRVARNGVQGQHRLIGKLFLSRLKSK